MKKQTILYSVFIACGALILAVAGCSKDDETETVLAVERDGANFANGAGTKTLAVTTSAGDWTVAAEQGQTWLTATREGSAVKLSVTESNERSLRTSYATITAGNRVKQLAVKQLGYEADILIEPETLETVPAAGGTVSLTVTANVDLTVTVPVTWISKVTGTRALPMEESTYIYKVEANQSDELRSAVLTFTETGGELSKGVEIKQAACPPTITASSLKAEPLPGAVKLSWVSSYTSEVAVDYAITDPLNGNAVTEKTVTVKGSSQVTIEDLRARYGEIEFTLRPSNDKGESGEAVTVKATADAAPVQIFDERTEAWIQIPTADVLSRVWTNSYETAEGNLEYLIDGIEMGQVSNNSYANSSNYFHQRYNSRNGTVPQLPNYIVLDLGKAVNAINFSYVGRTTGKDDPTSMDILVSNQFTAVLKEEGAPANKPEYVIDENQETTDGAVVLKDLPKDDARRNNYRGGTGGQPTTWKSEDYSLDTNDSFRYVWFKFKSIEYGTDQWAVLSELKIFEVKQPYSYDPETETETPLNN